MKFASAVFGGRKLNAVRADALRRRANDLCRVLRRKRQMCLSPIQTRSYCHRVSGGGVRGEPDGEGQVWPGLVWLYRLFKSITSVFRGCAGIDFVTFLST